MKVLLVSPVFHGYWTAMAAALRACGHDVIAHRYDDGGSALVRFGNALAHRVRPVAPWVASRATELAISALHEARPDAVLVVKGDMLREGWWDALTHARTRTAVWLYDELARMAYTTETLAVADTLFSYSPRDTAALRAQGLRATVLPDGFDALTPFTPRPRGDVVTFIGARYPAREQAMRALHARDISVAAYGREWSRNLWDVVRTRRWRGAGIPAHRDVDRADYYGIMAGSLATLNIHGDGHDGFSMRTFEAPGVGALQLVDRPDVESYYDVGTEVLVHASDDELVDHVERARSDPRWAQHIREAGHSRTLAEHTLVHRMREVQRAWE